MSEDLLLLRLLAPKVFRGVRFYFWLMFWLMFLVFVSGLFVAIFAPERYQEPQRTQPTHHALPTR
jgi:hypothetical protein